MALSTALAHMAVAEQLSKKQGDVATAVSMLEVAAELLRRHRGTPQLQVGAPCMRAGRPWKRLAGWLRYGHTCTFVCAYVPIAVGDVTSVARTGFPRNKCVVQHTQPALFLQADVASELAGLQPALAALLVALPLERFQERERGVQVGTMCICMLAVRNW